jgi:hypothetical protein
MTGPTGPTGADGRLSGADAAFRDGLPELLLQPGGRDRASARMAEALGQTGLSLAGAILLAESAARHALGTPALLTPVLARYPDAIALHLAAADLAGQAGTAGSGAGAASLAQALDLARRTGRRRSEVARRLARSGRRNDAIALLAAPGGRPDQQLADLVALHGHHLGNRDLAAAGAVAGELRARFGDSPAAQAAILAGVAARDGPDAARAALMALPAPRAYAPVSAVVSASIEARHLAAARAILDTQSGDDAPAQRRDDRARLLLGLGAAAAARDHLRAATRALPRHRWPAGLHALMARAELANGDAGDALATAGSGLSVFPRHEGLIAQKAEALFRLGRWPDLTGLLAPFPGLAAGLVRRQGIASDAGPARDPEAAIRNGLADGDLDAAMAALDAFYPASHAEALARRELHATLLARKGDPAAARTVAESLLARDPERPAHHLLAGRLAFLDADLPAARAARNAFAALRRDRVAAGAPAHRRDVPDLILEAAGPASVFADCRTLPLAGQVDEIVAAADPDSFTPADWMQFLYRLAHGRRDRTTAPRGHDPIPTSLAMYWEGERTAAHDLIEADWRAVLPHHALTRFDAASAAAWLGARQPPLARQFAKAQTPAQRADILRAGWLATQGGIWADADDRPRRPIDDWLTGADLVLVLEKGHASIANSFAASRPGHPVMLALADRIAALPALWGGIDAWMETGPGLWAAVAGRWAFDNLRASGTLPGLRLLRPEHYDARVAANLDLPHKFGPGHWRNIDGRSG